jgi:hypothetical protein
MTSKDKIAINEALKLAKDIELIIYRETRPDEEVYEKKCQEFREVLEIFQNHQVWRDTLLRKRVDSETVCKLKAIQNKGEYGVHSLLCNHSEEEIQKCLKNLK